MADTKSRVMREPDFPVVGLLAPLEEDTRCQETTAQGYRAGAHPVHEAVDTMCQEKMALDSLEVELRALEVAGTKYLVRMVQGYLGEVHPALAVVDTKSQVMKELDCQVGELLVHVEGDTMCREMMERDFQGVERLVP